MSDKSQSKAMDDLIAESNRLRDQLLSIALQKEALKTEKLVRNEISGLIEVWEREIKEYLERLSLLELLSEGLKYEVIKELRNEQLNDNMQLLERRLDELRTTFQQNTKVKCPGLITKEEFEELQQSEEKLLALKEQIEAILGQVDEAELGSTAKRAVEKMRKVKRLLENIGVSQRAIKQLAQRVLQNASGTLNGSIL